LNIQEMDIHNLDILSRTDAYTVCLNEAYIDPFLTSVPTSRDLGEQTCGVVLVIYFRICSRVIKLGT